MSDEFDVVRRVISILQRLNIDPYSVTLEEAKVLTLAAIIEHRGKSKRNAEQAWSWAQNILA